MQVKIYTFVEKRTTMRTILLIVLGVISLAFHAAAQHQNIMITNNRSPEEPSIFINPQNTTEIVAGSNIDNVFHSSDGGYTWDTDVLVSPPYGVWGDPVIIADTAGDFYFFHLSNPSNGNWIDRIVCQKSTDGGKTWNTGSYMGLNGTKAQDKQWAVVDHETNTIYVTWTQFDQYGSSSPEHKSSIMFSKSTDGGMTWSPAKKINEVDGDCVDDDNTTEGAVPAVGPNGEVYVAWAGPEGLVFDRSTDGGEHWLDDDIIIGPFPNGWAFDIPGISRCNGLPITLCDLSEGPNRGTIYVNWTDQRNGEDDTDVWLAKSEDGGFSWSDPIRINDDEPGHQQFLTWMDIDQTTGELWFVFYDRRAHSSSSNLTDVYMAYSKDGGETITNFKISETPFTPWSSVFFGDYNNVSAHNGVVRPIWTRLEQGALSVWTAIIDVNAVGIPQANRIPFDLELEQNFPNPFVQTTWFKYKLRRPETISLKIYNVTHQLVATLINHERVNAGKHTIHFDAATYGLSPGIYYFDLETSTQVIRKKMIYR